MSSKLLVRPGNQKAVLGMIHLQPLPGTPFYQDDSLGRIIDRAVSSAEALDRGGADGCLVQTVDRVYSPKDESDPARTAALALIVNAVVKATGPDFQVGVQIMHNALKASLAVAKVAGATYIRASAWAGMTLSPHGMVEADPLGVLEYRQKISASDVRIVAEIHSTHFRWFDGSKTPAQVARYAVQSGADAVCLSDTDDAAAVQMIAAIRQAVPETPVLLAGGTNHGNAAHLLQFADGAFVGTCLERGGWGGEIDINRVKSYVEIVRALER